MNLDVTELQIHELLLEEKSNKARISQVASATSVLVCSIGRRRPSSVMNEDTGTEAGPTALKSQLCLFAVILGR